MDLRGNISPKKGLCFLIGCFSFAGILATPDTLMRLNAERRAELIYGDKKSPLTNQERNAWYRDMGVGGNEEPNYYQLESFVERPLK